MKPICVNCKLFYRPSRNGVWFLEGMPDHDNGWKPYKLWHGDEWKCRGCGSTIIIGVAPQPMAEHYQQNFQRAVAQAQPYIQVNDC
jgi:hypothetical protein